MRKHIFQNFKYFFFKEEIQKDVRILAVCNTQKYFLYIFISKKKQASQLMEIKDNKTQPGYWPKPVTGFATVTCIYMLQWQ